MSRRYWKRVFLSNFYTKGKLLMFIGEKKIIITNLKTGEKQIREL